VSICIVPSKACYGLMMTKMIKMCSYICNWNKWEVEVSVLGCEAVSHPRRTDNQHCCRNLKTHIKQKLIKVASCVT